MLIIGAGGLATEVFDILRDIQLDIGICFYDDIVVDKRKIFNKYEVLNSHLEAMSYLSINNEFIIAIGGGLNRQTLSQQFTELGGSLSKVISPKCFISRNVKEIGEGTIIFHSATIGPNVMIKKGSLIYHNVQLTHDTIVGEYCDLAPSVILLGKSSLGNFVNVGAGSIILPRIKVGNNVIIGAGSVVTKNIPDNSIVAGIPARPLEKI